jgi:hypothetical protein
MSSTMKRPLVAAIACFVFGVPAVVFLAGRQRFRSRVTADVSTLFSDTGASVGAEQLQARWDALPDPVRRYLQYAVPAGAPAIQTVHLKHTGFFRRGPNQPWLPIRGEEYFTVGKPGFVWNATIRPAPFLWIEARDRLLSGRGNMLVKFNSTFTIADASGKEIDQGALLRWLAEAVWFPYGFVGERIRWEPIDDRSARATLLQGDLPVSAVVEVDEEGKFVRIRGNRYRDVGGGRAVLTPWIGRCTDYREFNGFRVPASVDVNWDLADGEFSYARFRVTTLEYNILMRFVSESCPASLGIE